MGNGSSKQPEVVLGPNGKPVPKVEPKSIFSTVFTSKSEHEVKAPCNKPTTNGLEVKPGPEVNPAQEVKPTSGGRRRKSKRVHWRHKRKRKSIRSVRR